ncbi:hypothetical protein FACS189479_05580 [Spirochaetia bacterium]|nr:hypothetical protein FACS189479_05580 [Spirochaetia bacterium]
MPRRKDDPNPAETVKVRLSLKMIAQVRDLWKAGQFSEMAESTFFGHLLGIGANVYEKKILPAETGESYELETEGQKALPNSIIAMDTKIRFLLLQAEDRIKNPEFTAYREIIFQRLTNDGPTEELINEVHRKIIEYGGGETPDDQPLASGGTH